MGEQLRGHIPRPSRDDERIIQDKTLETRKGYKDPLLSWLPSKFEERVEDFAHMLKGGLVPSDSQAYGHLRLPA